MTATEILDEEWIDGDAPRPIDPLDVPKGYELIDGLLVEMPAMGFKSSWVAGELYFRLRNFLASKPIGVAATAEASFACFAGRPKLVRKPDVSVVLCDPATFVPPTVNFEIAPDLVVEVVSPNDKFSDIEDKIELFIGAGTQLIWIVDPEKRTVTIHRANGSYSRLRDPAELSGEDVLPGFHVALADFLPRVTSPKSENPVA
jgi:Uma2 family endonuclease